ncbi:MAG TPA: hypothetical protein VM262_05660 [Acidimicrobiales bacterium]|nr:hypothetical protein [Acidimicrobiales bacterium]
MLATSGRAVVDAVPIVDDCDVAGLACMPFFVPVIVASTVEARHTVMVRRVPCGCDGARWRDRVVELEEECDRLAAQLVAAGVRPASSRPPAPAVVA